MPTYLASILSQYGRPNATARTPRLLIDPGLVARVAQQIVANGAVGGAAMTAPPDPSRLDPQLVADVESAMMLNPEMITRVFPVYLVGGVVSSGTITFRPQRDCVPFRLLIPKGAGSATIANPLVGAEPLSVASGAMPTSIFAEDANNGCAYLKPMVCKAGLTITATTTGASFKTAALFCADLSRGGIAPPKSALMQAPIAATAVGAGGSASVSVAPQKDFRLRRVALDDTVTNFAGCTVTSLTVANRPQFESGDGIPIEVFSRMLQAGYLEGDVAPAGTLISMTVSNPNAGAYTLQGVLLGDTE